MKTGKKCLYWRYDDDGEMVPRLATVVSEFYEPGDSIPGVNLLFPDGTRAGGVDSQDVTLWVPPALDGCDAKTLQIQVDALLGDLFELRESPVYFKKAIYECEEMLGLKMGAIARFEGQPIRSYNPNHWRGQTHFINAYYKGWIAAGETK
jgi:hypothetical protein